MGYIGTPLTGGFNLGDNTVTTQKIVDGTITGNDIASGTIQQANLASGAGNDDAKDASQDSNIALLGFLRSTDHATSVLNMQNGFIDQFEDQTGVDDVNSVNETYDATNDLYKSSWLNASHANTKVLMHFDGTDTSTTMTDEKAHAFSAVADAQIDTAQSKFGGASLIVDGTGDYVVSDATSSDWSFGTGDFTIEFWLRTSNNTQTSKSIVSNRQSGDANAFFIGFNTAGKISWGSGTAIILTQTTQIANDTWTHLSLNRVSGTMTIYADGVADGSASDAINWSTVQKLFIGGGDTQGAGNINAWIDELIIVKGTALRTTGFTPPTGAYDAVVNNMTLISEPQTALTAPDSAHVSLFNQEVSTLTINTDILAWVSRSKQTFTTDFATDDKLDATAHGLLDTGRAMVVSALSVELEAVVFDGTNDYLTRGADLTGHADGKLGTVSMWINFAGADASFTRILDGNAGKITVTKSAGNLIRVRLTDSAGTEAIEMYSTTTFTSADGWLHVLASWDAGNTTGKLYITPLGGTEVDETATTTFTNLTIDYTGADFAIGADASGTNKTNASIAQLYYDPTAYYDLTTESNRRKFIDANSLPIDFGADGSTPSGSQPIVFLNNALATWHTNLGSGGGFTENGALTQGELSANLPTGFDSETVYYVVNKTTNDFELSLTSGGAAVALTTDGVGTLSVLAVNQCTLVDQGDFDTGKATLSGTVDISGQPTGTDMTLVVQTKNAKSTKLHGQALQYS